MEEQWERVRLGHPARAEYRLCHWGEPATAVETDFQDDGQSLVVSMEEDGRVPAALRLLDLVVCSVLPGGEGWKETGFPMYKVSSEEDSQEMEIVCWKV